MSPDPHPRDSIPSLLGLGGGGWGGGGMLNIYGFHIRLMQQIRTKTQNVSVQHEYSCQRHFCLPVLA